MEQNLIKTMDFLVQIEKEHGMLGTIVAILILLVATLGAILAIGFIVQLWSEIANFCFKIITNGGSIW